MRNMIKNFLIITTLLTQLLVPSSAGEVKHYLAVYTMPGQTLMWEKVHPDLLVESSSYADLPVFLEVVRQQAGNRPIDLDLDMHGNDFGVALYADNNTPETCASVGYLCNQIDSHLDPNNVTVFLESCYSGRALHNTLDGNSRLAGKYYQDHPLMPVYPIYGVGARTVSCGNMIYLQYRAEVSVFYEDIRHWKNDDLPQEEDPDKSATTPWMIILLLSLWELVN
jgi:hypothetical protein